MRKEVIGDCTLYLGDCRDVLPLLPAGSVDAVITDPPYGISHKCNFKSRGRDVLAKCIDYPDVHDDDKPFDPSHILSMGVPTVLWGGNWFADKLPSTGGWLVWDKERPDTIDQATCELAWTNCVKGVRRLRHRWHGMIKASERGESYHPTQKPVALYSWILNLRWIPEGTVFDPYMGAGPCGVACVLDNRPYVGVEIEQQYFDTACKRIEKAYEQKRQPLFEAVS